MSSRESPLCLGCGGKIPIDESHDLCVYCLGAEHAWAARDDRAVCMNCFCMSARQREARCHFQKQATVRETPAVDLPAAKRFKPTETVVTGQAGMGPTPSPLTLGGGAVCVWD